MRYRNKRTGIELDFKSPVTGENWEPVKQAPFAEKPAKAPVKSAKEAKNGGGRKKQLRDGD